MFPHQMFTKLGIRYVFVKSQGRIAGLITKKDMILFANSALGTLSGINNHRRQAPILDPLIERNLLQRYEYAKETAITALRSRLQGLPSWQNSRGDDIDLLFRSSQ
jgi:hypothetical protein